MPNGNRYQPDSANSSFWKMRWARNLGPCPGWIGDPDQRRFRFERWVKLPDAAKQLYWRLRPNKKRYHTDP